MCFQSICDRCLKSSTYPCSLSLHIVVKEQIILKSVPFSRELNLCMGHLKQKISPLSAALEALVCNLHYILWNYRNNHKKSEDAFGRNGRNDIWWCPVPDFCVNCQSQDKPVKMHVQGNENCLRYYTVELRISRRVWFCVCRVCSVRCVGFLWCPTTENLLH